MPLSENPENLGLRQRIMWKPPHGFNYKNESPEVRVHLGWDSRWVRESRLMASLPPVCDPFQLSWCPATYLMPRLERQRELYRPTVLLYAFLFAFTSLLTLLVSDMCFFPLTKQLCNTS